MFAKAMLMGSSQAGLFKIDDSLRFNDNDAAYLSRTPSVAGDRDTWTWSGWVKRGNISTADTQVLCSAYSDGSNRFTAQINSADNISVFNRVGGSYPFLLTTTALFRDSSAWYHMIISVDTTQAVASDRAKLYINGARVTAFDTETYPSQNSDTFVNSTNEFNIGRRGDAAHFLDGYLSNVHFIDGQALDPTSFGKQDADGVWQPISYTGTYGTNGFHLDFALGDGWSGLFDGSGDAITTPSSTNFSPGTGDFTFEFWINAPDQANKFIYDNRAAGIGPHITTGNSPSGALRWGNTNLHSTSKICDGTWHHAAVTRESGTIKLWVDGVLEASGSDTYNYSANNYVVLGSNSYAFPTDVLNGRLSNLRAVIGTAVYTANFTPPAAPLTAITNTQLLTFQDSTFVDNSANGFSLSVTGNVVTDKTSPFNTFADDTSGNGNDWTPANFTADDVVSDTPTANYCTLNPLNKFAPIGGGASPTFSDGNLNVNADNQAAVGTFGVSSGKWYYELTQQSSGNLTNGVGWYREGTSEESIYRDNGAFRFDGTEGAYGASWQSSGDIIGIALDLDNTTISFYKNGVSQGSAKTNLPAGTYIPLVYCRLPSDLTANFGQRPFAYTPPTGFVALSSANLPVPTIKNGKQHFQPVLYTGSATTQAVGGLEFQPDFVWIKRRDGADSHVLVDAVRGSFGAGLYSLFSDLTNAESTSLQVLTLDSDGFTLEGDKSATNRAGQTYVAWNWNAGNSTVTNNDGTITSQVRANTDAGISIVSYVGNGTDNATVGHGLGVAPGLIISKNRDTTSNWTTWHGTFAANDYIALNLTSAKNYAGALTNVFGGTDGSAPSSTVVKFGTDLGVNGSGQDIVLYCFAEVDGFSKFGSYTGNGSADGPFVYTGFRPAFVMTKPSSRTASWSMYDYKRLGYNPIDVWLRANGSDAESTSAIPGDNIDLLSNGFKLRNSDATLNGSGETYIYMAFAENPFKKARAR